MLVLPRFTALLIQGSFYLSLIVVLHACLPTPQVKQLNSKVNSKLNTNSLGIPNFVELTQVPFFPQTKYHCGPAAVATLLSHKGTAIDYKQVVSRVYTPGKKGSLQSDVLTAIRRYNYLSYTLQPSFEDLLREVAAGRPVLVLQNLGVKWISKWHYAVVVGYDLNRQKIILRSGKLKRRVTRFKLFERTWRRSGYWAIVALKPGELPIVADPLNYLRATVVFEKQKKWKFALSSYIQAENKWPNNLIAKIGVANALYHLNKTNAAIQKYNQIIKQHPTAADAYNNLANLLAQQKQYDYALIAINQAIKLGGHNLAVYKQTKQEILTGKKAN